MTLVSRLKEDPIDPDLTRLGAIVAAMQDRLRGPRFDLAHDAAHAALAETVELVRSIEEDDGWHVYALHRGEPWQKTILYLDAPQVFLRAFEVHVDVWPRRNFESVWPYTIGLAVRTAALARAKRLGREVEPHNDDVLISWRNRRWEKWGRG
jgi:hypothetical protein